MKFILYHNDDDEGSVNALIQNETIWLTQKSMSSLFDVAENNITYHLQNIDNTKELEENWTTQKIRVVQKVGNRVSDECTIITNYENTEVIIQ